MKSKYKRALLGAINDEIQEVKQHITTVQAGMVKGSNVKFHTLNLNHRLRELRRERDAISGE